MNFHIVLKKKSPKSQAILAEHLAQQPLCDLCVNCVTLFNLFNFLCLGFLTCKVRIKDCGTDSCTVILYIYIKCTYMYIYIHYVDKCIYISAFTYRYFRVLDT